MLRFDDKVAVITGAGGGLGRAHALLFAIRGAKVVVNDLGGSATGGGKSSSAADRVVEEIRSAGGTAAPSYDSVEDGDKVIQCALDNFGRVDIVVNNAGILRDKSFAKMSEEDWDLVYRVHVRGSFRVTHAAWPHLREQQYGRVIMTASAAGIYGNFGQANYSMAKLGLAGFANTLALEGKGRNIHVNTIAPIAGSRLTEGILPADLLEALKPEYVSPLVAYLCHESCEETGGLFEVGGGFFGKLRWERAAGKMYRRGRAITIESVRDDFPTITSFESSTHPADVMGSMQPIAENAQAAPSKGGNEHIDVDAALGYEFPETKWHYDARDLALYGLAVGAASDPYGKELRYVYELHSDGFTPLPTFAVVPAVNSFFELAKTEGKVGEGLHFGFDRILHGEQRTELLRPLPSEATLTQRAQVKEIWDKGKNAIVVIETKSYDQSGELLIVNDLTIVARGCGGWGGERGPSSEKNVPPKRAPDAVVEEKIAPQQALLYRLTGDWNPLHADPSFAKAVGFEKPILHGLCTFGYAGRHVINTFKDGDARFFKSIDVRMAASVYPGETLVTEMWKESPQRIIFQCKVKERDEVVLKAAAIELYDEIPKPKPKAAREAGAAPSGPISADVFAGIESYVKDHPELTNKINTIFQFQLTDPESTWTIDMKAGAVAEGETAKPDCTLQLTDADFMGMVKGELDPQKLFMSGKLKISGNIMASQKLTFLQKVEPERVQAAIEARGGGGGAEAPSGPTSAGVFGVIADYVKEHPELTGKVSTVFQFKLTDPESVWTLDLKSEPGAVAEGETVKPDCTLQLTDADFMAMTRGELDPQKLFMEGRLKISGNIMASQKLTFLQKIDPKKAKPAAPKGPAPKAKAPKQPKAPGIFEKLAKTLKGGGQHRIVFVITEHESSWTVDLTKGTVEPGAGDADAVLTMTDEALAALSEGASPRELYQRGEMRVDGNLEAARDLGFLAS